MPAYLVERYWPGVTSQKLLEALQRARRVMEEMTGEGMQVHDISCTLIPGRRWSSLYMTGLWPSASVSHGLG